MQRPWRYHFSRLWFPLLTVCLLAYFIYHFISGDHGLLAFRTLTQELNMSSASLEQQEVERQALEQNVHMLSNTSLDPDLLDERIRVMLNHAHDNEIVILLD